jgi:hypothetical protein
LVPGEPLRHISLDRDIPRLSVLNDSVLSRCRRSKRKILGPMPTYREVAEILAAVAWPVTVTGIAWAFYRPVVAVLEKLKESLLVKGIKLKLWGAEIELTPDQADRALNEMIQNVVESTQDLSVAERNLFERIHEVRDELTVEALVPGFTRESEAHNQLRRLQDVKLIRPIEGGKWTAVKHPVVTRFGEIFWKLTKDRP